MRHYAVLWGIKRSLIGSTLPPLQSKTVKFFPKRWMKSSAMELLMSNPILIRRPLMMIGDEKLCGFDEKKVSEILDRYVEAMPKSIVWKKGVWRRGRSNLSRSW
jgi:hypothetical protein